MSDPSFSPSSVSDLPPGFGLRRCSHPTGVLVVDVVGELDGLTAPLLLAAVRHGVEAGHSTVVLDLADVTFCSMRGVGTLVEIMQEHRHGGVVRLARPSSTVRRVAALTRTDGLLGLEVVSDCPPMRVDAPQAAHARGSVGT